MKTQETITYVVNHPCNLYLTCFEFSGEKALDLGWISSVDEEEDKRLQDDGELQCWDADVKFIEGAVKICGADGPSGGSHKGVIIIVPQALVKSITVEDE